MFKSLSKIGQTDNFRHDVIRLEHFRLHQGQSRIVAVAKYQHMVVFVTLKLLFFDLLPSFKYVYIVLSFIIPLYPFAVWTKIQNKIKESLSKMEFLHCVSKYFLNYIVIGHISLTCIQMLSTSLDESNSGTCWMQLSWIIICTFIVSKSNIPVRRVTVLTSSRLLPCEFGGNACNSLVCPF